MPSKLFFKPPAALSVLAVVIFLGVLLGREASTTEDLPIFLPLDRNFIHVELDGAGFATGVYQFYDGSTLSDVMKLTGPLPADLLTTVPVLPRLLQKGESLEIVKKDQRIEILRQGWMRASHRVAMAIPLHPDRMSRTDWTVLPGVGDALAERIEINRQNNGDFKVFDALIRVKGIGEKRIESWRAFFE
jgi:competence protein ComEA